MGRWVDLSLTLAFTPERHHQLDGQARKLLEVGLAAVARVGQALTRELARVGLQNAQEMLSPGYLATMRANSLKRFRQNWW